MSNVSLTGVGNYSTTLDTSDDGVDLSQLSTAERLSRSPGVLSGLTGTDGVGVEPQGAEPELILASSSVPGSDDNELVNSAGWFESTFGNVFEREGYLVDDEDGYRAFAHLDLSLEGDGTVLRVRGMSEGLELNPGDGVPARIRKVEYIQVYGQTEPIGGQWSLGGQFSRDGNGGIGGGLNGGSGETRSPETRGDLFTREVINVRGDGNPDHHRIGNDLSATINLPPEATRFEYKMNVVFEYDDGRDPVYRSVSANVDLPD